MTTNTDLCKNLFKETEFSSQILVITANQRLAVYLQYHLSHCSSCKQKPYSIQPLSSWLETSWKTIANQATLLEDFEEQLLWQQIINATPELALLRPDITARTIQSAWNLLQQWQISLATLETAQTTEETSYLIKWIKNWQTLASQYHWLTKAELATALAPFIRNLQLPLVQKYLFIGFDELYPQLKNLMNALQLHSEVKLSSPINKSPTVRTLAFNHEEEEIYMFARWAKHKIDMYPDCRIGCIVPNLQKQRDKLARILNEVLTTKPALPGTTSKPPFSISLGKALSSYPLIQTIFMLLRFTHSELDIYDCSRFLRSPYLIGANSEMFVRSALEKKLYQRSERRILARTLLALSREQTSPHFCPQLANHFQDFLNLHKKTNHNQYCSYWAEHISTLLTSLGWPGEMTLTSEEFQLKQRWQTLLEEFSKLDQLYGKLDFYSAVSLLQQLCNEIIFQPQGDETASIQILGVLEAAGMQFDYLWLIGMDEQNWPPLNSINPFIPFALQRQVGMPHANPEQDWRYYQKITERLCHSGNEVIASFAMMQNEQTVAISPLLKHITAITQEQLRLTEFIPYDNWLFQFQDLETLYDFKAPTLASGEKLIGGSAILKQQAACPFSAFAKYRLAANCLEELQLGLNANERGSLLHIALESVWNLLANKLPLDQLDENELNTTISQAVNLALTEFIRKKPLTLKQRFLTIEKQRLSESLHIWLAEEKQRKPFKIVARELASQIKLNDYIIHLRIDRIDELEDGSVVIIDYKTGAQNYSYREWLGPRPDDPQLPLYCLGTTKPIAGVAFAQINPKKIRFNGITLEEGVLPKVKAFNKINDNTLPPNWQTLMADWQVTLTNLINDYRDGDAKIAPKYPVETCRYCDLKPLCRFNSKQSSYAESY